METAKMPSFSFLIRLWWQSGVQHNRDGEEIFSDLCENPELCKLFHWEKYLVWFLSSGCTLTDKSTFRNSDSGSQENPALKN
jgi:hypothetical protein